MPEIAFNQDVANRFMKPSKGAGGIVDFLGFELTGASPGRMTGRFQVRPDLLTGFGIVDKADGGRGPCRVSRELVSEHGEDLAAETARANDRNLSHARLHPFTRAEAKVVPLREQGQTASARLRPS